MDAVQARALVERERRVVEDADARGVAVKMSDGRPWFVRPLPLNARGTKIAEAISRYEDAEAVRVARERSVVMARRGMDEAEDEAALEAATGRLQGALARRATADGHADACRSEIAYHALRSLYDVSREEASELVTERQWEDVLAALRGADPAEANEERLVDLLGRLARQSKEATGDAEVPLASRPSTPGRGGA